MEQGPEGPGSSARPAGRSRGDHCVPSQPPASPLLALSPMLWSHRFPSVSQPGHFLSPLGFTLCFLCLEHCLLELSFKVSSSRSGTLRTFGFCVPIASRLHLSHCDYTLLLYFLSRPGAVDDVKRENEGRGGYRPPRPSYSLTLVSAASLPTAP